MAAAALSLVPAVKAEPLAGTGLAVSSGERTPWASLHWRVIPSTRSLLASTAGTGAAVGLDGSALVADLYLSSSGLGAKVQGGLRATSGLVARSLPAAPRPSTGMVEATSAAMPYLGFGYSGLHLPTGWGLSADLGLVAAPGTVRLGRSSFTGGPALEDAVRDLRLTPVMRLGVSYAF
jgi:hypothetical protein